MADRDPLPLPLEVRARLAELELELSEDPDQLPQAGCDPTTDQQQQRDSCEVARPRWPGLAGPASLVRPRWPGPAGPGLAGPAPLAWPRWPGLAGPASHVARGEPGLCWRKGSDIDFHITPS
ncbi:unnamed protein product [Merluccius merluccius]